MAKAYVKSVGISPYKARLVANLIRGLPVLDAEDVLVTLKTPIAKHFLSALKAASASETELNSRVTEKGSLKINSVTVDGASITKRHRAKARGSAGAFNRPSSHITLHVEEAN